MVQHIDTEEEKILLLKYRFNGDSAAFFERTFQYIIRYSYVTDIALM